MVERKQGLTPLQALPYTHNEFRKKIKFPKGI